MNQTDDRASSKYLLINQILCARKLEKEPEVRENSTGILSGTYVMKCCHREGIRKMNEIRDLIIGIDIGKNIHRSVTTTGRQRKPVPFP